MNQFSVYRRRLSARRKRERFDEVCVCGGGVREEEKKTIRWILNLVNVLSEGWMEVSTDKEDQSIQLYIQTVNEWVFHLDSVSQAGTSIPLYSWHGPAVTPAVNKRDQQLKSSNILPLPSLLSSPVCPALFTCTSLAGLQHSIPPVIRTI